MKSQLGVVSLILSLLSLWHGVLGGQIPEVNGVLGGVSTTTRNDRQQELLESARAERTPGKLRGVVENSGVCGWLVLSLLYDSPCVMPFFIYRNDSRSLSSFRIW